MSINIIEIVEKAIGSYEWFPLFEKGEIISQEIHIATTSGTDPADVSKSRINRVVEFLKRNPCPRSSHGRGVRILIRSGYGRAEAWTCHYVDGGLRWEQQYLFPIS